MLSLELNNVEHGPVLRSKECFDDLTYAEACCSDIFGQILSHIVTFHHRIAVFPTLGSNLVGEGLYETIEHARKTWSSCGIPSWSLHLALFLDCRTHHNS